MKKASSEPSPQAEGTHKIGLNTVFYDDSFFPLTFICLSLMVIVGAFILGVFYENTIQPEPEFFATTPDGRLVAPLPLSDPALSAPALLEWVVEASTSCYAFNFVDYEKSILAASKYFTKVGYQNYRKALIDSNVIELVRTSRFVVSATPTSAPVVLKETVVNGIYAWQVQLPMLVVFQSSREQIRQSLILTMLVIRVPQTDTNQGVAIAAMIVRAGRA